MKTFWPHMYNVHIQFTYSKCKDYKKSKKKKVPGDRKWLSSWCESLGGRTSIRTQINLCGFPKGVNKKMYF